MIRAALALALLLPATAAAGTHAEIGGHVKAFFVGVAPYDHLLMPDDPTGSAALDSRLRFEFGTDWLDVQIHPTLTVNLGTGGFGLSTGVGRSAPEAVPLSGYLVETEAFSVFARLDRLSLKATAGPVDVTLGRQAITFGQGLLFTPMDLVAPFTPTTVDTSYKPGVDALRIDIYAGMSGQITPFLAYLGDWDLDGLGFGIWGQGTIVTVDLAGFAAAMYGDVVLGASVYAPVGPIGIYGDAVVTIEGEDDAEFRGMLGVQTRPGPTTTLNVELYGQTFGTTERSKFLAVGTGDRWQRGELWLNGHFYVGAMLGQEITPLINLGVGLIGNLLDPSFLLTPSLSFSLAENADLSLGGFIGMGKRPEDPDIEDLIDDDGNFLEGTELLENVGIRSEFGTYPVSISLRGGFYF